MAHRKVNKHFFIRKIVEKQFPYDYEIYVLSMFCMIRIICFVVTARLRMYDK